MRAGVFRGFLRGRRRRAAAGYSGMWYQYAMKNRYGEVVLYYPSLAACNNDPIWKRGGNGAYSVVRPMIGWEPAGEWKRSYVEDFKTLRQED